MEAGRNGNGNVPKSKDLLYDAPGVPYTGFLFSQKICNLPVISEVMFTNFIKNFAFILPFLIEKHRFITHKNDYQSRVLPILALYRCQSIGFL